MSRRKKTRSNSPWPMVIVGLGLVMLAGSMALLLKPAAPPPAAPATGHSVEDTFPEIARINLEEAKTAFDSGAAVFLDVRDPSAYAESHVPGAVSIPLAELDERWNELDRSAWIITYCT